MNILIRTKTNKLFGLPKINKAFYYCEEYEREQTRKAMNFNKNDSQIKKYIDFKFMELTQETNKTNIKLIKTIQELNESINMNKDIKSELLPTLNLICQKLYRKK